MEIDYQRALEITLPKFGVLFQREVEFPIYYDGIVITKRRVDFVYWDEKDRLLLETKAAQAIRPDDVIQCLLYVTKGNQRLVLLVNFGEKPIRAKRFVNTPEAVTELDTLLNANPGREENFRLTEKGKPNEKKNSAPRATR